jgi:hypothetical protein
LVIVDGNTVREVAVAEPQVALLYQRVLAGNPGLVQIWFDQQVLDRYRGQSGFRVIRTNTVGRVRAQGGWSLDFGIADEDRLIHASAADLIERLPAPERQHWASQVVTPTMSRNFVILRLGAGSCMDDGEVRDW